MGLKELVDNHPIIIVLGVIAPVTSIITGIIGALNNMYGLHDRFNSRATEKNPIRETSNIDRQRRNSTAKAFAKGAVKGAVIVIVTFAILIAVFILFYIYIFGRYVMPALPELIDRLTTTQVATPG